MIVYNNIPLYLFVNNRTSPNDSNCFAKCKDISFINSFIHSIHSMTTF